MDFYGHDPSGVQGADRDEPRALEERVAKLGKSLKLYLSPVKLNVTPAKQAAWIKAALKATKADKNVYTFGYRGLIDDSEVPSALQGPAGHRRHQEGRVHGLQERLELERAPVPSERVTPRRSSVSCAGLGDRAVVDGGVGGDDHREVHALGGGRQLGAAQAEVDELGDVRVVVGDVGAALAQQPDDLQRR